MRNFSTDLELGTSPSFSSHRNFKVQPLPNYNIFLLLSFFFLPTDFSSGIFHFIFPCAICSISHYIILIFLTNLFFSLLIYFLFFTPLPSLPLCLSPSVPPPPSLLLSYNQGVRISLILERCLETVSNQWCSKLQHRCSFETSKACTYHEKRNSRNSKKKPS